MLCIRLRQASMQLSFSAICGPFAQADCTGTDFGMPHTLIITCFPRHMLNAHGRCQVNLSYIVNDLLPGIITVIADLPRFKHKRKETVAFYVCLAGFIGSIAFVTNIGALVPLLKLPMRTPHCAA